MRLRSLGLWVLAFVVTVASAVWQRATGPSHPARGSAEVGGQTIRYRLPRSAETGSPLKVVVAAGEVAAAGELAWRRFPSAGAWQIVPMSLARDGAMSAEIPSQPPAGKVEYQVRLTDHGGGASVVPDRAVIARFKGPVPARLLVPHILAMFVGMLLSTRAGLGALCHEPRPACQAWGALVLIVLGGLLLGPLVQRLAFGALWTGWPLGHDLTDNKTAAAALAWAWAVWRMRHGRPARAAVVVAAAVTLAVFSIPHSAWGSELRWDDLPRPAGGPTP